MAIKWKSFQLPKKIEVEESTFSDIYGSFVIEPLERGFGLTLGNALRRVLLSAIQGAAVTNVKIDGVLHEFGTIPGVVEDVTEVLLNVKGLVVKMEVEGPHYIRIHSKKTGDVLAKHIEADADVEIINPDHHILSMTKDTDLRVEMEVNIGRGYQSAEKNKKPDDPIGVIPVDSIFTPVRKVNFTVENTRVGEQIDFDRLVLQISTNGSVKPDDALAYASKILRDHLKIFINFEEEPEMIIEEEKDDEKERMRELLLRNVNELELSVRSSNCLNAANIKTLADLVRKSEQEMLKYRNFGRKSLSELQEILKDLGLSFGMDLKPFGLDDESETGEEQNGERDETTESAEAEEAVPVESAKGK
jgi:DNA-directed RNA polymerase subunit alpha